jgi:hypothetical protein
MRKPYYMWPRYVLGLINLQWLMFSRMAADLVGYYRMSAAAGRLHTRAPFVVAAAWRLMTRFLRAQSRGAGALVPDFALPEHIESVGVGTDTYDLVREGRLIAKRAEISRFVGPETVELSTGETMKADLVVFATGFSQQLPFLHASVREAIQRDGGFHLYRCILPPRHRTLALNGYNSSTACQLTAEVAAHWISDCFAGRLDLPRAEQMDREIAARRAWLGRVMPGRSDGFFLGPCGVHYVDELLRDMGLSTRRRRSWLAEHFLPAWPSNYATLGAERRARKTRSRRLETRRTASERPATRRRGAKRQAGAGAAELHLLQQAR